MGHDLALINKIQDPLEFCRAMAPAAERICGAKTEEEGMAINLICLQEGISYMDFNRKYHLIKGKPSMKYDSMLAAFKARGGKYSIIERTAERACVRWEYQGEIQEWEYTWEQAKQDRWPWKDPGSKTELKDNWSTPSDRRNMLFARLTSDSLRVICPEVAEGIYTPEEIEDMSSDSAPKAVSGKSAMELVAEAATQAEPESDVVEAEFVVKEEDPKPEPIGTKIEDFATPAQVEQIVKLFDQLAVPVESRNTIVGKRLKDRGLDEMLGISAIDQIARDQASEIIERLREKVSSAAKN